MEWRTMHDQQWLTATTAAVVFQSYLKWDQVLQTSLDSIDATNASIDETLIQTIKSQLIQSCENSHEIFPDGLEQSPDHDSSSSLTMGR